MPTNYTKEEKIEMINWYYGGNGLRKVKKLFAAKYPQRRVPCNQMISNLVKEYKTEGCILEESHKKRKIKRNTVLTEEMKFSVLSYIEEAPVVSVPDIIKYFGISKSSVYKILNKHCRRPNTLQVLHDDDKEKRIDFCETMFDRLNENEDILQRMIFTDDASFTLDGKVNSQNFRYFRANTVQHVQKVNVWLGIINTVVVGPYFVDGSLTAPKFNDLLQNSIIPSIDMLDMKKLWFQMDDAPAHSSSPVVKILNERFPGRWIGKHGPVRWPPRSADLSPHNFFIWDYLKSLVYNDNQVQTLDELKELIVAKCAEMNPDLVRNALQGFRDRLAYCLEREGGHFEHLLNYDSQYLWKPIRPLAFEVDQRSQCCQTKNKMKFGNIWEMHMFDWRSKCKAEDRKRLNKIIGLSRTKKGMLN